MRKKLRERPAKCTSRYFEYKPTSLSNKPTSLSLEYKPTSLANAMHPFACCPGCTVLTGLTWVQKLLYDELEHLGEHVLY